MYACALTIAQQVAHPVHVISELVEPRHHDEIGVVFVAGDCLELILIDPVSQAHRDHGHFSLSSRGLTVARERNAYMSTLNIFIYKCIYCIYITRSY